MIRNLGYIGFLSPAAESWRTFGPEVLGAELVPGSGDTVRLRVDEARWRIAVHPGDVDDLAYLGWDAGDDAGFGEAVTRIERCGYDVHRDTSLARERDVVAAAWFVDPFGFRHEVSHGLATGGPFTPGRRVSRFVTGEQGLGHVVLLVPDAAAAEAFLVDALGFVLSDTIEARGTLRFFHCPGHASRHHTVALAQTRGLVGLHHLMLEVGSLDDVGTALDVVTERGIPLAMGLGRHPNDLMTSFYVRTPSGFEIEYGTGGVVVDDEGWTPRTYEARSLWGHRPPASGPLIPGILRPFQPEGASA